MSIQDRKQLVEHITEIHCANSQQPSSKKTGGGDPCRKCPGKVPRIFGDAHLLQEHVQMHHDQHYCKNCNLTFSGSLKYREHLRNHHPLAERVTNVSSNPLANGGSKEGNPPDASIPPPKFFPPVANTNRRPSLPVPSRGVMPTFTAPLSPSSLDGGSETFIAKAPPISVSSVEEDPFTPPPLKIRGETGARPSVRSYSLPSLSPELNTLFIVLAPSGIRPFVKSSSGGVEHQCPRCVYSSTQKSNLTRHFESCHITFSCRECYLPVLGRKMIIEHVKKNHKGAVEKYDVKDAHFKVIVRELEPDQNDTSINI